MAEVIAARYKVERIFQLLVTASAELLQDLLRDHEVIASSHRDAFASAAHVGLLPDELAARLLGACKTNEMLVDRYYDIDYEALRDSIEPASTDFATMIAALESRLPPEE